ncbi:MAG: hypothetical protein IPL55_07430 [Saprospiraceae bacterium]|nr:hypothetical protein [Saprospiraceae bacterium]
MKIQIAILLISALALFSTSKVCTQNKKPLNILLFTADDLDKNGLGCYGSKVENITPNIDKFDAVG